MKRIGQFFLTGILLMAGAGFLMGQATSTSTDQSLGDYARSVRKQNANKPPAAKEYNNDNLPTNDKLSVVGNTTDDASADQNKPAADNSANKDAAKVKPGQSPADRQQVYDEWKGKIADQKNKVDLASRELDVLQREYKLRAASFYADAGDRLRNSEAWDKEDADYKAKLAAKQAEVDAAKKDLDDLQEQARKSGVPESARE